MNTTFYQNFADGFHINESDLELKRLFQIQNKFETIRNEKALDFILLRNNKNKLKIKLLEIGSGRGGFARLCQEKGIQYFGIEPQIKLFKSLKKEGLKIKNLRVPPISYQKDFFDFVCHFHVVEHLQNSEEVYNFFKEINSVLRRKGKMIFRCPNAKTWGFDFWDVDYTHTFFTTPRRIEQILYDTGFKMIYFEEFSFLKPYHFGKIANFLSKIKLLDNFYPKITAFLGRIFKKNTELFYVCQKL